MDKHIAQWKHNRELLHQLPLSHPDWIVTVVFYTALHAIDALLRFDEVPAVTDHANRMRALTRANRYRKVYQHFHTLYTLSRTVRYMADPAAWIPPGDVNDNVLKRHLYPIENSVQKLMKTDLSLPLIVLKEKV